MRRDDLINGGKEDGNGGKKHGTSVLTIRYQKQDEDASASTTEVAVWSVSQTF